MTNLHQVDVILQQKIHQLGTYPYIGHTNMAMKIENHPSYQHPSAS